MRAKKVYENYCSKTLLRYLSLFSLKNLPILDAPCGYGRNTFLFLKEGYTVVGVDIDKGALEFIDSSENISLESKVRLKLINKDLLSDLSFPDAYFGGVINVHFYNKKLLGLLSKALAKNGLLFIETPGNQGDNFVDLPFKNEILSILANNFDFIHYFEIPSKKDETKVSVKCLAKKK